MLSSLLPAPKYATHEEQTDTKPTQTPQTQNSNHIVPPYGDPARSYFTPVEFDDGGALPEIHSIQFPMGLGRKDGDSNALVKSVAQLKVDANGNVLYDAIIKQDMRSDQVVYAEYKDLVPYEPDEQTLQKPSDDEVQKGLEKTRKELQKLTTAKTAASKPRRAGALKSLSSKDPQYVRYTPSGAKNERVIRIHEVERDPLEPSRFKHKKLPQRPPSPPVPVLQSPPRKVSKEDQAKFKIPPCVSNWKNIKGYTITMDKRLAADGRGLREPVANSRFASFTDALYQAELAARAGLRQNAEERKQVELAKKEVREKKLAELARSTKNRVSRVEERLDEEEFESREHRDDMRRDMDRERNRAYRMSQRGGKKEKRDRELERDISERVALRQGPPAMRSKGAEDLLDSRLFNQSQGLGSGFGADDNYSVYDKSLFRETSARIYRPSKNIDEDIYGGDESVEDLISKSAGKFQPDKGFEGTEAAAAQAKTRSEPVQFEHDDSDVFGLEEFFSDAKKGKKANALDKIGKRGYMAAAAGGGTGGAQSSSVDKKMSFKESKVQRRPELPVGLSNSKGESIQIKSRAQNEDALSESESRKRSRSPEERSKRKRSSESPENARRNSRSSKYERRRSRRSPSHSSDDEDRERYRRSPRRRRQRR